ncbi:hypothetical protein D3C83_76720 [compost metagenome]
MQRETSEAPDLDALPARERLAHEFENMLHGQLDVLGREVLLVSRNRLDQFRFCHRRALRTGFSLTSFAP